MREYVEGTGGKGGALVTSFNVTSRSDLRLYESDGNATMRSLLLSNGDDGGDGGDGGGDGDSGGDGFFLDTCVRLLARMIDTVPGSVALGDVVTPLAVKPVNVTWDVVGGNDGRVVLSGRIRVCSFLFPILWISLLMSTYLIRGRGGGG